MDVLLFIVNKHACTPVDCKPWRGTLVINSLGTSVLFLAAQIEMPCLQDVTIPSACQTPGQCVGLGLGEQEITEPLCEKGGGVQMIWQRKMSCAKRSQCKVLFKMTPDGVLELVSAWS